MRKRTLTLLLTVALGAANAQGTADQRLNPAPVTMEIGRYGGPLSSLLAAVAQAAGYDLVLDANVDALPAAASASGQTSGTKPVVYSFKGKPFNEVWPLLMDVYGLSYEIVKVGTQDVIRVSDAPIQRVIRLSNANAADAVNQIKLFFGTPQYTETQQKDAQGNVVGVTRTLSDVKLDSATLRIVADLRTNSLIVRGTNREIAQVERLATEMDRADTRTGENQDSRVVQRVYSVRGTQEDIVALLAAQYPNLRVTPVGKTGQLVMTGPANQLDSAFTLLGQVDKAIVKTSGPPVIQQTFTLSNAQATDVKVVLEGTLRAELSSSTGNTAAPSGTTTSGASTTAAGTTATAGAPSAAAGIGTTIIADQRTNSLIVRGTQEQVDQIAALIPLLDKSVPQINVQIRIQEITETAARNLGIDWSAGIGNFVTKIVGGTLTTLFDATKSFAGFNLGATLNALERQNLSKSIYDGTVTLQSGQRNRGQTGATENASALAAATIKSGGRLELNIPSTSGNITKQIDYGVLIDLLNPQVSADGAISIGVKSNVSALVTPISGATLPNVLQFTNREAQTNIAFKSGQTVMLGGLLSTTESDTTEGVPLLSSIPLVGNLFKTTRTNREKTQLLIVITGNVVQ